MGNIYLTSDWHFNHDKDFIWKARGFESVQEMNETIIRNHNEIVTPEDTVYVLGDCMMGQDMAAGMAMIRRMNGVKYLAYGNHDTDARIKAYKEQMLFEDIQMGYRIKYKGKTILLTHYPTITANGEDTRVLGLYGHTHQENNIFEERIYMYHVGVDSHNCKPVLIDDALAEIKKRKGD